MNTLALNITEYFVICLSCWKHGPARKTIEQAVKIARINGWVYVPDLCGNYCPDCAQKAEAAK